jgi:hypothetical protein
MVCSPSAATDLFIEEIHYALERERTQAAEVEAQLREHRSPAPMGAPLAPAAHGDEGQTQVRTPLAMQQQPQQQRTGSSRHTAAPSTSAFPTPSHPAAIPAAQWASPTAFLHVPPAQAHVQQAHKPALDVPASASGMVTPAKQTMLGHTHTVNASPLPVPQSADRAALLSAFSALSAEDLMAVKPLRSANGSGASSLFHATPAPSSPAHAHFSGPFATPLRTPSAGAAFTPDRAMRQPHFQHIAL